MQVRTPPLPRNQHGQVEPETGSGRRRREEGKKKKFQFPVGPERNHSSLQFKAHTQPGERERESDNMPGCRNIVTPSHWEMKAKEAVQQV